VGNSGTQLFDGGGEALLVLRKATVGSDLDGAVELLSKSGRAEPYVRAWCAEGEVLCLAGLDAGPGEDLKGVALIVPLGRGNTVEVRLLSVASGAEEFAPRLLADVIHAVRAEGPRQAVASASSVDLELQRLLQNAGFRPSHIERDACRPEDGWTNPAGADPVNRDLIWFELVL
jgi:hypothetical protein